MCEVLLCTGNRKHVKDETKTKLLQHVTEKAHHLFFVKLQVKLVGVDGKMDGASVCQSWRKAD